MGTHSTPLQYKYDTLNTTLEFRYTSVPFVEECDGLKFRIKDNSSVLVLSQYYHISIRLSSHLVSSFRPLSGCVSVR